MSLSLYPSNQNPKILLVAFYLAIKMIPNQKNALFNLLLLLSQLIFDFSHYLLGI